MNNFEWTEEQKQRIVEIDNQERRKGKNFMKVLKENGIKNFRNQKEQHKTWLTMQRD